ncbi:hypothetical protein HanIR_Chr05g0244431 [Helianthus annuus]|nr:hypothetical protein HanIR_Chr05g0244431 [Helianthus annuus]
MRKKTYSCNSAAKAANLALMTFVESKKWQNMNMERLTHGFEYFIVHLEENCLRV